MDLKSKVGPLTAVVITSATVLWMMAGGNGIVTANSAVAAEASQSGSKNSDMEQIASEHQVLKRVQARTISATTMSDSLTLSGTTQASEDLTLTVGYSGNIQKLHVRKGDFVKKGQTILTIDTRALRADIEQAKTLVKQKELELDGATRLVKQKLSSEVALAGAKTELAQAKANLRHLQIDLENASLKAPFSGILNTLDVKEDQLVQTGTSVGLLVAIDPLTIQVNVPQKKFNQVSVGTLAEIELSTGQSATGVVSYIDSVANAGTRSIAVEIEVANAENLIPAEVTAKVVLTLPDRKAHAFSPALLTLDDAGRTAVKTLNLENEVQVTPVEILKSGRDQVWVAGLPQNVNLITVGQGFTKAGEKVEAVYGN